jgi:hypothetical protein
VSTVDPCCSEPNRRRFVNKGAFAKESRAVIRAVIDGGLVPVWYTNRFRGITVYLFRSEDLRKYRPVPGMTVHPEGVVTFGAAAAV